MIEFTCEYCGFEMKIKDSFAGKKGKCPRCNRVLLVPGQELEERAVTEHDEPKQQAAGPSRIQAAPLSPDPAAGSYLERANPPTANLNVNLSGVKSTNGLGIASLVLGILAALICWIPVLGLFGIPLAGLGLLFGIIGFLIALIGRKSGVGMPVSGAIVCAISLAIAIASTGAFVGAVSEVSRTALEETETAPVHDRPVLDPQKQAYVDNILLKNVAVGKSVLNEQGVFGEVKNIGTRTLKKIQLMIYCLDNDGNVVFEKDYHPLFVSDSRWLMNEHKPLKPNYSRKFGCKLDDAPSDWSGQVRLEVIDLEFAD